MRATRIPERHRAARRVVASVGAAVVCLGLASCGQGTVGAGNQPPQGEVPPAAPAPVVPKPEGERAAVPEVAVDASRLAGFSTRVWTQDGGHAVVVIGQEGGCSRVHAEPVEQTPQHVTLRLVESTPDPPKICTMDLRYPHVAAQLSEPLGERKVILEQAQVKVPR